MNIKAIKVEGMYIGEPIFYEDTVFNIFKTKDTRVEVKTKDGRLYADYRLDQVLVIDYGQKP